MKEAEDSQRLQYATQVFGSGHTTASPEEINGQIKKNIKPYSSWDLKKSIILHFADNTKVQTETLSEAIHHPGAETKKATFLQVTLKCGDVECELELPSILDHIHLKASPETSAIAREVFRSFRDWIRSNQQPLWTQYWFRPAIWIIGFIGVTVLLSIVTSTDSHSRADAHALLDKGLAPGDELKALRLLLEMQSEYSPTSAKPHVPLWAAITVAGTIILCTLLTFRPYVVLGIGKRNASVVRWRWYIKLISYSLPVWILYHLIIPPLATYLKGFLH